VGRINRREFVAVGAAVGALPLLSHAAQRKRQPNILFFFSDQHRFDWIGGTNGLGVRTPNLDALAGRGIKFTRTITASPLSAPARACLAAGRDYPHCAVRDNTQDYPLDQLTYFQVLREAGYHVIGCGKLDLHKATRDWGLDGKRFLPEWGFSDGLDCAGKLDAILSGAIEPRDPYMAYLHRRGLAAIHVEDMRRRIAVGNGYTVTDPTPLPEEAYCDNWIAQNGLELLRAAPAGRPWFLTLNFAGPHNPLDITRRMEKLVRGRQFPQPVRCEEYPPEKHVAIRQNYTAMVENIDRWIGVYIEELRRRGESDSTLVVYSSDHGEMLGDHNRWARSVPYQPSVGVPLVIAGHGVEHAVASDALVSLIDLAATFLDYAGAPRPLAMESRSLRPVLDGKSKTHREFVRSGLHGWRMVFDGRYKLVRGFNPDLPPKGARGPRPEPPLLLFDLKLDPQENFNLAKEAPSQVERLSRLLTT
jgi:arylsulfatase